MAETRTASGRTFAGRVVVGFQLLMVIGSVVSLAVELALRHYLGAVASVVSLLIWLSALAWSFSRSYLRYHAEGPQAAPLAGWVLDRLPRRATS